MSDERSSGSSGFGRLLREFRLAAGLSQEALAERARMSTHGVSALERGYRRSPHRDTLALLVEALGLGDEQRAALERAAARPQVVRRASGSERDADASTVASNLPFAATNFIGRDKELDEIAQLLREHRLVTITGSGGVGKTQTALQAAGVFAEEPGAAARFVALAPLDDPAFVVTATLSALGAPGVPGQSPLQTLLDYLSKKRMLLVFDNCEHVVVEAAGLAGSVLSNCKDVRILATSRESLRVGGEHTYRLPSLGLQSAVELFTDRACAADHNFALDEANMPSIEEICRRLDGIPLAIELAAARVRFLSVKAISERLDDRLRILTGGERTALARQQTMRAAIDWSYDLLAEPERLLFERISVFAGGCTLPEAFGLYSAEERVEADLFDALSSLVDKSLVVADFEAEQPRYRLLECFKQYAREKLILRGEEQMVVRRFAVACLEEGEQQRADRRAGISGRWLSREGVDNRRAALQWALAERNDVRLGQRLAAALPPSHVPTEVRQWLTAALDSVDETTSRDLVGRLWFALAMCAFALREFDATVSPCQEAIAAYRDAGELLEVAFAEDMAGHALTTLGRIAEAKPLIDDAMTIARSLGDARLTAWTLRCLAHLCARSGDVASARAYLVEALPVYRTHFIKGDLAFAINDLGAYEFCAGNPDLALVHAREMLSIAREGGLERVMVTALDAMATYLILLGRYDEAEGCVREALRIATGERMDAFVAYALQNIAAIAVLRAPAGSESEFEADQRGARLLGYVDTLLSAKGSSRLIIHEQLYERVLLGLRARLGEERLRELRDAGATMDRERAVAEALAI